MHNPPPSAAIPQPFQVEVRVPRRSKARNIMLGVLIVVLLGSLAGNIIGGSVALKSGQMFERSTIQDGHRKQVVAIYEINDVIRNETSQQFTGFYRQLLKDKNVKAVILRVDSPGGECGPCDEMYEMVKSLRTAGGKKVIVAMGGAATSGAYFLSSAADEIIAQPTTITGGLGVIATWPVLKKMINTFGADVVIVKAAGTEQWMARENKWEIPDDRVRQNVQDMLNVLMHRLRQAVQEGRGRRLSLNAVTTQPQAGEGPSPFNGRTYMVEDALKLGLIDSVGFEQQAIERASVLAGLSEPKVVRYKPAQDLLGRSKSQQQNSIQEFLLDNLYTPRIMMIWKSR